MIKKILITGLSFLIVTATLAQKDTLVKKKDRKRDIVLTTNKGDITLRLSDSTPIHRDNFIKLVKKGFFDSLLFHRVIKDFMIQGGDPLSKNAPAGKALGTGSPGYTLPAEFRTGLFHKKGMLAAARMPDNVNPSKVSNGSQFYIVKGKIFTDEELDQLEKNRLKRKIPASLREVYKTIGGSPHLDQEYTIYGEVVKGQEVVDQISVVKVDNRNRPEQDVMILRASLVKRKRK